MDRLPLKEDRAGLSPWLYLVALLGGTLRLVQALRVAVPSNDGASYLSMVEAFARGDLAHGFSFVFPPGTGLLVAPLAAVIGDSLLAFSIMGAVASFLGILALGAATSRWLHPGAGLFAGSFLALLSFSVRSVGEAYSESFFVPFLCLLLYFQSRGGRWFPGLCLGACYWLRPEALAFFPLLFVGRGEGIPGEDAVSPWKGFALGLSLAFLLPLIRTAMGGAAFPKFDLMRPMGPLGAEGSGEWLMLVVANLGRVPGAAFEGLDFGIPLLALSGGILLFRRFPRLAGALLASVAFAVLAQVFFQVKARFFVDQAPLWIVAATGLLLPRGRTGPLLCVLALLASGVRDLQDVLYPPRRDKRAELLVGKRLRGFGLCQGDLLTDMPRVAWAAGLIPPPPVIWTAERLEAVVQSERPRFVVLGVRRPGRLHLSQEWTRGSRAIYRRLGLDRGISAQEGRGRLILLQRRE